MRRIFSAQNMTTSPNVPPRPTLQLTVPIEVAHQDWHTDRAMLCHDALHPSPGRKPRKPCQSETSLARMGTLQEQSRETIVVALRLQTRPDTPSIARECFSPLLAEPEVAELAERKLHPGQ
ncbi:unnamed protein product [Symbiodinium natans]|uniref:Uncharacterized protein n=1 Tax=Symbiodinium natans TaxID=878477 RepID=A0A812I9J2_9DINO|nr:unnamed protein product [Symbiodinium natans]